MSNIKLSEEKVNEFRCAFELFDKNKVGKITTEELSQVLKDLGQNPTKEELDEIIKEVDQDNNKSIEFPEFLELMSRKMKDVDTEEEMMEAFKIFDKDGNGFVSKDDIKTAMDQLGEKLKPEELDEIMKDWDEDGDGQLNYEEFKCMMQYR
jgi:calmodulin